MSTRSFFQRGYRHTLLLRLIGVVVLLLSHSLMASPAESFMSIRGQWQQGGILIGQLKKPGEVRIAERRLAVSDDGYFVFGLGRDHPEQVTLTFIESAGARHEFTFPVSQRSYDIQRIEGVQQKHVTPPAQVTERIRREGALVRKARQLNDSRDDFSTSFVWPLSGPITGVYGSQRVYNGVPKSPHYGVDIAAPTGTKVRAPAAGVVTLAEADLYYSGGTLIVDHGHGLSSTFIHLHKVLVEVGERVEQGDIIAEVGASGRATGPHLDWRMNWFAERVDPQLLMDGVDMPKSTSSK